MNTKLTLTIEENVVQKAKTYAQQQQRSLSDIIERYLVAITDSKKNKTSTKKNSIVSSLKGSFTAPANLDYKRVLKKRIKEKYT